MTLVPVRNVPGVEIAEHSIDRGNNGKIRMLVYEPGGRGEASGALLWMHGGGLIAGMPEQESETCGRPAWKTGQAIGDPDESIDRETGIRRGVKMLFQTVPETKEGKNRIHLDLHYGADRIEAESERLEGLGARRLWTGEQGPSRWIVMADPESNEFCVHS